MASKKRAPSGVSAGRKKETVDLWKMQSKLKKRLYKSSSSKDYSAYKAAKDAANKHGTKKAAHITSKGGGTLATMWEKPTGKMIGKFGNRIGRKLPVVGAALTGLSLAAKAKKVSASTKKKKKKGKK